MTVSSEIRAELARQRKTMTDLSDATGIPRTTLSHRLNDHSDLDTGELDRIGDYIGVPGWELLRRASEAQDVA